MPFGDDHIPQLDQCFEALHRKFAEIVLQSCQFRQVGSSLGLLCLSEIRLLLRSLCFAFQLNRLLPLSRHILAALSIQCHITVGENPFNVLFDSGLILGVRRAIIRVGANECNQPI